MRNGVKIAAPTMADMVKSKILQEESTCDDVSISHPPGPTRKDSYAVEQKVINFNLSLLLCCSNIAGID